MMWIHATPAQRDAMTRADLRKSEAQRMTPAYQSWLAGEIAALVARRDAKQAELENGGFARRLNRQIEDLNREIAELQICVRHLPVKDPVEDFCNALREYAQRRTT